VLALHAHGVTDVVEIGAGKVLSGLVKRIETSLNTANLGAPGDIDSVTALLKQA
jgi:[acyl-carrier-protein] S-malonyltransferase